MRRVKSGSGRKWNSSRIFSFIVIAIVAIISILSSLNSLRAAQIFTSAGTNITINAPSNESVFVLGSNIILNINVTNNVSAPLEVRVYGNGSQNIGRQLLFIDRVIDTNYNT